MAVDKNAPFSKTHRRYWLPVTGGMILIGLVNVAIGYWMWPKTDLERKTEVIKLTLPAPTNARPDARPEIAPL
jgi:hypothetical protein